ncbi:MAG: hypothetical protein IPJ88_13865 [Myxococcales bacterium]|nr:MAG: hypothetical protein IPJ88_13865 [Myxococcales bacterium]
MSSKKGYVLGAHLRSVIRHLPTQALELGEYQTLAESIDPEAWYDWDIYVTMSRTIAARMPSRSIVQIGTQLVTHSRDLFVSQGFDSIDKVFSDASAVFRANSKDVDESDDMKTVFFEPGHAIIEVGGSHVPELIEGFIYGFIEAFEGKLLSLHGKLKKRAPDLYEYDIRYES